MPQEFYISNSQIVFSYGRNVNIRKRVFEFEDALSSEFKVPFKTIAIPDEIDPIIPRFESQSLHGHSRIQVSQNRIALATKYNELFKLDYKQVKKYVQNKCAKISTLTENENMEFVAYIVELGIHMEKDKINAFIKSNTGVKAIKDDCLDFSLLYSYRYKEDFYLNIKCSKFTEQEVHLNEETKSLRPTGNNTYGISVVIDINSRPHFKKNKVFDVSLYEKIEKEVFNIIQTKKIEQFLNGKL